MPFIQTHMSVWVDFWFVNWCRSYLCVFLAGKGRFKTRHWCGNSSWATFWFFWCLRYGLCCQCIRKFFNLYFICQSRYIIFIFWGVINLVYFLNLILFTLISGIVICVFVIICDIVLDVLIIDHSFDLVIKWLKVWIRIAVFIYMAILKSEQFGLSLRDTNFVYPFNYL